MCKTKGYHITVSGRVQGVGYRYYCMETARSLGLAGWVMNKDDGTVELEVFGDEADINIFMDRITATDRTFNVADFVKEEAGADIGYKDFTIKFY